MKPCALLTINHEGHKAFWRAISAKKIYYPYYNKFYLRQIGAFLIRDLCKTYLVEDLTPLKYMKHRAIFKKRQVIDIIADGLSYVYLTHPKWYYNEIGLTKIRVPKFIRNAHLNSVISGIPILDGAIAVSSLVKKYFSQVSDIPTVVVPPSISNKKIKYFKSLKPNINSFNIITVGSGMWKGLDITLGAFKIIQKEIPKAKLYLKISKPLIKVYHNKISRLKNVFIINKKLQIEDYLNLIANNSVYLQTSYFDPHPVAVAEAMAAGVIPIVSKMVGTKDLFSNYYPNLISNVDANDVAEKVLRVFEKSTSKKRRISQRMRILAKKVYPSEVEKKFKKEYRRLIKMI